MKGWPAAWCGVGCRLCGNIALAAAAALFQDNSILRSISNFNPAEENLAEKPGRNEERGERTGHARRRAPRGAPATGRPAAPAPAAAGSLAQGHISWRPDPAAPRICAVTPAPKERARGLRSNPWASAAPAGRWGRGDSGSASLGDSRARHPSGANKSKRTALLRSSPGPPPLRVFPAAPTAGEVQVARRPPTNPTQTNLATLGTDRCRSRPAPSAGRSRVPGRRRGARSGERPRFRAWRSEPQPRRRSAG